jgi:hypothetical protein
MENKLANSLKINKSTKLILNGNPISEETSMDKKINTDSKLSEKTSYMPKKSTTMSLLPLN